MEYTTISNTFTTLADCKKARKMVIKYVCKNLGVNRKVTRIPWDLITLYGFSPEINDWVPLVDRVGDYGKYLKSEEYTNYRLQTEKYGLKQGGKVIMYFYDEKLTYEDRLNSQLDSLESTEELFTDIYRQI